MNFRILAITALAVCILQSCNNTMKQQQPAPNIDMKSFFKNGEKSSFTISPNGQYYAYLADYNGKMNIHVQEIATGKAVRVTSDTIRSISGYFWKEDRIVYGQDVKGDENYQVFSVKPDGSEPKSLTPFAGVRSQILDDLKDIPGREKDLVIATNKRDPQHFDPYMLNIETGELKQLYDNTNNFDNWITDNDGVIRIAVKSDGANVRYYYRANDKDTVSLMLETTFKESFYPTGFDSSNSILYVLTNIGRDKIALVEYDPIAKKELRELYTNADYDLERTSYDSKTKKLKAVYWNSEKSEYHFFDDYWAKIQKDIDDKFKGNRAYLSSYTNDRTKAIIGTYSDRRKGRYFSYDMATGDTAEISNPFPWLDENEMAETKPIKFKTRDGITLHGYLTVPKGVEAKNLPVVLNPHGGPWHRDVWGFNDEVQFLANRGYAVLQINFRGSTGYGKEFWMKSFKQWGKTMQDDLTDGVDWLVKEGIADPKRVAIYGASYGGYATLAGLVFTPDVYCCGVDYVGVSNLFTFMNTIPPYWKPYLDQIHEMVGDPVADSALLAAASPALHADKIKVPLFIAQGANDPRVNKNESDQMVEALKKRGITVEYMVKDDEGHGFHNQDNQYDFYGAMEKFLAQHLKGAAKP